MLLLQRFQPPGTPYSYSTTPCSHGASPYSYSNTATQTAPAHSIAPYPHHITLYSYNIACILSTASLTLSGPPNIPAISITE